MSSDDCLQLNLGGNGPVTYKLHPVVVFSILDNYKRRKKGLTQVVGTLLGEKVDENTVYIRNCFAVIHEENGERIKLNMDYHESMLRLHERVNRDEKVIGWYSTVDNLSSATAETHDTYTKICGEDAVHLTVDVGVVANKMAIKAYTGSLCWNGKRRVMAQFNRVALDYHTYEAEKIGVEALINGEPDDDQLDAPATILNDSENLVLSMRTLLDMLGTVAKYAKNAASGEIKGDPEVGRQIKALLAAIPKVDPGQFTQMFNANNNDLLVLVYLANLTRTQLALADKVSQVIS